MSSNIPREVEELLEYLLKNIEIDEEDKRYALMLSREYICNYCNRDDIPRKVYSTWSSMALDILKNKFPLKFKKPEENEVGISDVSSINVGDTTLSISSTDRNKKAEVKSTIELENAMISTYKTQLHRIRKLNYDGD